MDDAAPVAPGFLLMPNPNVLVETGYALSSRGADRCILVMDRATGPISALPFDIAGNRISDFSMPESQRSITLRAQIKAMEAVDPTFVADPAAHAATIVSLKKAHSALPPPKQGSSQQLSHDLADWFRSSELSLEKLPVSAAALSASFSRIQADLLEVERVAKDWKAMQANNAALAAAVVVHKQQEEEAIDRATRAAMEAEKIGEAAAAERNEHAKEQARAYLQQEQLETTIQMQRQRQRIILDLAAVFAGISGSLKAADSLFGQLHSRLLDLPLGLTTVPPDIQLLVCQLAESKLLGPNFAPIRGCTDMQQFLVALQRIYRILKESMSQEQTRMGAGRWQK